jgi:serine/threonine protein kinase
MLAYELATGRAYFKGKTPTQIMKILGQGGFQPPLSTTSATNINGGNGGISNGYGNSYGTANNNDEKETPILIQDKHLVDLIRSCLQIDPKYRITVNQILRHSYFKQQLRQRQQQQQQAPPPQQQQQQQQEGGSNSGGGTYW